MKIPSFYGSNEWNGKTEFHKFRAGNGGKTAEMRNNSAKSGMVGMSAFMFQIKTEFCETVLNAFQEHVIIIIIIIAGMPLTGA